MASQPSKPTQEDNLSPSPATIALPKATSVTSTSSLQGSGTSSYRFPTYILGRTVDEPGESSPKPRLGVKVPNLNLSSQILSREELCEEVAKRSARGIASKAASIFFKPSPGPSHSKLPSSKVTGEKGKLSYKSIARRTNSEAFKRKSALNTVVVVINPTPPAKSPSEQRSTSINRFKSNLRGKMTKECQIAVKSITAADPPPNDASEAASNLLPGELFEEVCDVPEPVSFNDVMIAQGEEYVMELEIPTSEASLSFPMHDITLVNKVPDVEAAMAALYGEDEAELDKQAPEPLEIERSTPNGVQKPGSSTEQEINEQDTPSASPQTPFRSPELPETEIEAEIESTATSPGISFQLTEDDDDDVTLVTIQTPAHGFLDETEETIRLPLDLNREEDAESASSCLPAAEAESAGKIAEKSPEAPETLVDMAEDQIETIEPEEESICPEIETSVVVEAPEASTSEGFSRQEWKNRPKPAKFSEVEVEVEPAMAVEASEASTSEEFLRQEWKNGSERATCTEVEIESSDLEIVDEIPALRSQERLLSMSEPPESPCRLQTSAVLRRKKTKKLKRTRYVRKNVSETIRMPKPKHSRDLSNLFCDEGVINIMLNASQAATGRRRSAPGTSDGLDAVPTNLLSKGCLKAIQSVKKTIRRKSTRLEKSNQATKPYRKKSLPAAVTTKQETEEKEIQEWQALPTVGGRSGQVVYVPKKKAVSLPNPAEESRIVRRRSWSSDESSEEDVAETAEVKLKTPKEALLSAEKRKGGDLGAGPVPRRGRKRNVGGGAKEVVENEATMEIVLSPRKKGPSLLAGLEKREKEKRLTSPLRFGVPGTSSGTGDSVLPPMSPDTGLTRVLSQIEYEEQQKAKRRLLSAGNSGEEDHTGSIRTSLRQTEGSFHYKEITLRKQEGFVHILLNPTSTKLKNSFSVQVLKEVREALLSLSKDPTCKVVLVTSHGPVFCQGIDLHVLVQAVPEKRKKVAEEMAAALKDFLVALAHFNKPLVAGVNGAALGLGVTMLPYFDVVWASEKAIFYTPYSKLGQVPEGAVSLTFYQQLRQSLTSVLLFEGRSITASEAVHQGLANGILWPSKFQEELVPRVQQMATQSSQAMEATKALLRHPMRSRLEAVLNGECRLLVQHWTSAEGQRLIKAFLESDSVVV